MAGGGCSMFKMTNAVKPSRMEAVEFFVKDIVLLFRFSLLL